MENVCAPAGYMVSSVLLFCYFLVLTLLVCPGQVLWYYFEAVTPPVIRALPQCSTKKRVLFVERIGPRNLLHIKSHCNASLVIGRDLSPLPTLIELTTSCGAARCVISGAPLQWTRYHPTPRLHCKTALQACYVTYKTHRSQFSSGAEVCTRYVVPGGNNFPEVTFGPGGPVRNLIKAVSSLLLRSGSKASPDPALCLGRRGQTGSKWIGALPESAGAVIALASTCGMERQRLFLCHKGISAERVGPWRLYFKRCFIFVHTTPR